MGGRKAIDLTGQNFGRWNVLSRVENDKNGNAVWKCQCGCEKMTIKNVVGVYLRSGRSTSCGCNKYLNLIDHKFTRWTVLKQAGSDKHGATKWLCECSCEEKNRSAITTNSLLSGNSESCGCLYKTRKLPNGESSFNKVYNQYKSDARKKDRKFNLTKEQAKILFKGNCYYCGCKPSRVKKNNNNTGNFVYNGIDRIDNNIGYEIDNCVSCCYICNKAKGQLPQKDFLIWVSRLHKNLIKNNLIDE